MRFSLPLVGLLACSLLLLSFSALCSQVDINGLELEGWGEFYSKGSVVSPGSLNAYGKAIEGPFNASNNPTIWVEEAFLNTDVYDGCVLSSAVVYVYIMIQYKNDSPYVSDDEYKLLGVISSCSRGDSAYIALYCSFNGVPTGMNFTKDQWNNIGRLYFKIETLSAGISGSEDSPERVEFLCKAWLRCDVIPYVEPEVPQDVDLSDILKEEMEIDNSINNGNSILSDINGNVKQLLKKDFQVEAELDTSALEGKIDAVDLSIDNLSDNITDALDEVGDSITGAIDGLADSIGGGINVEVGDVSVETDISWFQEGEGDTDLGEFDTDDVVSRSDYNSLFDPIGRATGALYLADRTSTLWNDFSGSSSSPLVLARLPENMGGGTINLPTWSDVSLVTGQDENSGLLSSIPAFIGACIGLIVSLCLFTWIYNLITR